MGQTRSARNLAAGAGAGKPTKCQAYLSTTAKGNTRPSTPAAVSTGPMVQCQAANWSTATRHLHAINARPQQHQKATGDDREGRRGQWRRPNAEQHDI